MKPALPERLLPASVINSLILYLIWNYKHLDYWIMAFIMIRTSYDIHAVLWTSFSHRKILTRLPSCPYLIMKNVCYFVHKEEYFRYLLILLNNLEMSDETFSFYSGNIIMKMKKTCISIYTVVQTEPDSTDKQFTSCYISKQSFWCYTTVC